MTFIETLKNRRSIYALGKNIDGEKAIAAIKEATRLSPTAFNSQSGRILVVTEDAQDKLWNSIVAGDLEATMKEQGATEEAIANTKEKLAGFGKAYGTVLIYEDQDTIKDLQEKFDFYAENFPVWSEQGTGIVTMNIWGALTEEGIGANLQHYNPVIDADVAKAFDIPANWKLRGQLVFGSIEAPAADKEFISDDVRFKVAK
ncbi:MAG: nitroreductase family protein [Streptococcaceae bacterium]|jgi:predicted oxidoreductase (fatty acid repression mutant protein)|nr:nitroreductase family protein [Streptococcaceae bacterium]